MEVDFFDFWSCYSGEPSAQQTIGRCDVQQKWHYFSLVLLFRQ